jgi:hypothetical protein
MKQEESQTAQVQRTTVPPVTYQPTPKSGQLAQAPNVNSLPLDTLSRVSL